MKFFSENLWNARLALHCIGLMNLLVVLAVSPAFSQSSADIAQVSSITKRAQSEATALLFVANLAETKADYKKAIESYNKLLSIYKSDPGIGPNSAKCAWVVSKIALCYSRLARREDAAKKCKEALAILNADTYDNNPADDGFAAMARDNCSPILGKEMPPASPAKPVEARLRIIPLSNFVDIAESEKQVKEAVGLMQKKEASAFRTYRGQLYLADIYTLEKKYTDAEPLFKKSIAGLQKKLGKDDKQLVEPLSNYGYMLQAAGKQQEADNVLKRIQKIIDSRKTVIVSTGGEH